MHRDISKAAACVGCAWKQSLMPRGHLLAVERDVDAEEAVGGDLVVAVAAAQQPQRAADVLVQLAHAAHRRHGRAPDALRARRKRLGELVAQAAADAAQAQVR